MKKPTQRKSVRKKAPLADLDLPGLSEIQTKPKNKTAKQRMTEKYLDKRSQHWPSLNEIDPQKTRVLWEYRRKGGFVNIPKAMPLVIKIMNHLTSGSPVGATYLALWCRDFGTGFFEINDLDSLALEAGFTGTRATGTLNARIKMLSNETDDGLGFIRTRKSTNGKYRSILMLNPMLVIYMMHKDGRINPDFYNELLTRCIDVGDKDFEQFESNGGIETYREVVLMLD